MLIFVGLHNFGGNQHWNRVTTADPDDPLTQIAIQVRPGFDLD